MVKSKAHWALTIKEETYNSWTEEKRKLFDSYVGKNIELKGDRLKIDYDDRVSYYLSVGFKEMEDDNTSSPHWHCLVSNMPRNTCTANRVRQVMASIGMPIDGEYLQPIDTSPLQYMAYCHKTKVSNKNRKSEVDVILSNVFKELKDDGIVSKESFLNVLCDRYGPTWITKNRTIIDTFCSMLEQCYAERLVVTDEPTDIDEITKDIIIAFHDNILHQIETNGIDSKCEAIRGVKNEDVAKYICFTSLLPYMFQRAKNVIDFIPGLYFWGNPNTGKSFIFQLGKAYRVIATDSVGIGKFNIDVAESAFLLDDVRGDAIDANTYMSTLRRLALGTNARIKVHSTTKEIKGWCAVTSNEMPRFLTSDYDSSNRDAWLRRFIVLEFKNNPIDEMLVNGNEFEYKAAQEVIAGFMMRTHTHLLEQYGKEHRICKSIEVYAKHLTKYLSNSEAAAEDGAGPDLDTNMGNHNSSEIDKPVLITAANKIEVRKKQKDKQLEKELKTNKRQRITYSPISDDDDDGFDLSNGKRIKLAPANEDAFAR